MNTRKKARRRWPLVLGVCVLAIALVGASFFAARSRATEESLPETCTIARGDVEATITGNGRLESTIESPVRGRIKYLPAGEGDDVIEVVCQYGALAVLSTDGLMQVALETGSPLALHTEVSVKWSGGEETGTVAARTQDGYVVTLDNGNAPYRGRADVYLDDVYIGSGTMEIHAPLAVLGAGGTLGTVHYEEGDEVYAGTTLFTLDNEPAVDAYRQTMAERGETAERLRDVLQYQSTPYVYRLDGDGQQVRTPIQTGLSDGTNAQVLSGLQEGDTIVCGGETRENPGQAMGFAGMLERREALMGGETDA